MKKLIILISALILCAPLLTCSDTGLSVKLKVYYSSDGFTGYYVADGGNAVLLNVGSLGSPAGSNPSGIYEIDVAVAKSLKVQVNSVNLVNTLTVMIYKDGLSVKDGSGSGDGYSAATVTLTYEYDAATTTTTTTTATK